MEESVSLDLDALAPKKYQINYKGQMVEVEPPTLAQYGKILELGKKMRDLPKDVDPSEALKVYADCQEVIGECMPAFKDENLNPRQIMALITLIGNMAMPEDAVKKELKEKGVELDQADDSPKDSASSEQ